MMLIQIKKEDKRFPDGLKKLKQVPKQIFCYGNDKLLGKQWRRTAVVGSRKMTNYGKKITCEVIRRLSLNTGVAIVTGLALGVDTQAIKSALRLRIPIIAVVAGGIGQGYPKLNQSLYDDIIGNGLIVAEYDKIQVMSKGLFVIRNRIIAGISDEIVLVESDINGGAINTVNYAKEIGVKVNIVVGSVFSDQSRGCNDIIRSELKSSWVRMWGD